MVGSNIQLCGGEEGKKDILLIRTNLLKKCPPSLLQLLSIRGLRIGGDKVQSDLTRLSKHFKELQGLSRTVEPQSVCDLSRMAVERGGNGVRKRREHVAEYLPTGIGEVLT